MNELIESRQHDDDHRTTTVPNQHDHHRLSQDQMSLLISMEQVSLLIVEHLAAGMSQRKGNNQTIM